MTGRTRGRAGLLVVLVVLTFLHFALGPVFDSWYASPNLLICAVLIAARHVRPGAASAIGFVLGLLEDSMAVSHFGLATLLLVLLGYLGSRTRDLFLGEEPLFIGAYLFLGTWIYEVLSYALLGASGGLMSYVLVRAPLDALATSAVGYVTLPALRVRWAG